MDFRYPLLVAVSLAVAGCATGPREPKLTGREQERLNWCQQQKALVSGRAECFDRLANERPLVRDKGRKIWEETIRRSGPNAQLFEAVAQKDLESARMALAAGADPKHVYQRSEIGFYLYEKVTALWVASFNNDSRMIEMLLQAGADPGWVNPTQEKSVVKMELDNQNFLVLDRILASGYRPTASDLLYIKEKIRIKTVPDRKKEYQEFYAKAESAAPLSARNGLEAERKLQLAKQQKEEAWRAQQEIEIKREEEALYTRARREVARLSERGTQVCRLPLAYGGRVMEVGWVEGSSDYKIQVRVAQAFFVRAPELSPGGFAPRVIWDSPYNWKRCN